MLHKRGTCIINIRITVVTLMVVRSSRMQRTRTIAAAIKSIYYARVCYIHATHIHDFYYSCCSFFLLFVSRLFIFTFLHAFSLAHTHAKSGALPFSYTLTRLPYVSLNHALLNFILLKFYIASFFFP